MDLDISDSGLFFQMAFDVFVLDDRTSDMIIYKKKMPSACLAAVGEEVYFPMPNQMAVDGNIPLRNILLSPTVVFKNLRPEMLYFVNESSILVEFENKELFVKGVECL
jgi:hypothetical protein